jgi:hypothetical protein
MTIQSLLVSLLVLALAGCGSDSSGSDATASDSPTAEELAAIQQAELAAGGTGSAEALVISARTYTSGSVRAKVTGFFEADGTQEINRPASITDDDQTWIQYGVSGAQELNVLFTNSTAMAENGVNIGVGPYTVTAVSTSGECRTKFDVNPASITGHYSCTGSTGYNNKTGQMGKVDIEVDFSAGS